MRAVGVDWLPKLRGGLDCRGCDREFRPGGVSSRTMLHGCDFAAGWGRPLFPLFSLVSLGRWGYPPRGVRRVACAILGLAARRSGGLWGRGGGVAFGLLLRERVDVRERANLRILSNCRATSGFARSWQDIGLA